MQKKLFESLPHGRLVRLERVQNRAVCKQFVQALGDLKEACGGVFDFENPESYMKELWHAADPEVIDEICSSKIGFGFGLIIPSAFHYCLRVIDSPPAAPDTSTCRVCNRFDPQRAIKPGFRQKVKDLFRVGGHVYGYGSYFAKYALYSHWWYTRVWADKRTSPRSRSALD